MSQNNDHELAKALFLDLDHTLIRPKEGRTFPKSVDDWELCYRDVPGRIHQYIAKKYIPIIITNQGGIQAGYLSNEEFLQKMQNIRKTLQYANPSVDYIHYYYCSDLKSYDRKPNPGMFYQAAIDYELSLKDSLMVGDMDSDRMAAENAGVGRFIPADEFFKDPV